MSAIDLTVRYQLDLCAAYDVHFEGSDTDHIETNSAIIVEIKARLGLVSHKQ